MNRIRETIEVAEPLWRALEQMSHDLGVDRDALVAQALFMLARQNGYVAPTPVALGVTGAGEPVRAPAPRPPEPSARPAVPPTPVAPVKGGAPAVAASEPVKARARVDEAAQARARMQEVLTSVDAVVQPRDVPVASDDEEESDEEDSDDDASSDEGEEAGDASSDEGEEAGDEASDEDEAAAASSDDEAADDEASDEDEAADASSDDEAADGDSDEEEADEGAASASDDASADVGTGEDEASGEGSNREEAAASADPGSEDVDDADAADIAAAIGSEELPGSEEDDDSEPEEPKTGEEAAGAGEDAARAAASEAGDEKAAASASDEAQDAGSEEQESRSDDAAEEQDLPFVAPPASKASAVRRRGRVLRSTAPEDTPAESNKGRKAAPAPKPPARMDLFVRLSPDGPSTRVDVERFTLGRGPQCSLVVKSGRVSREHAIVVREGNDYFIEDLNSSNGTWINHKRIKRQRIADGDTFNLGTEAVYFSLQPSED